MKKLIKLFTDRHLLFLILLTVIFFYPFFLFGKIPIPADTIVGMYNPFRDTIWNGLTAGVPFKNPLITDPVRQQYVWRSLSIEQMKNGHLPLWNPYSFSGTPLLANFQSAVFNPFNLLFLILPFPIAWGIQIILQPLLGGIFTYLYLRHFNLRKTGCFIGAFSFAFCGFSIAWLEWNTIGQTILWLPFMLLVSENLLRKFNFKSVILLTLSMAASVFGGHLQILFYLMAFYIFYLLVRIMQLTQKSEHKKKFDFIFHKLFLFFITIVIVIAITSVQWKPTLVFISRSAREIDQGSWMKPGWFIPWQNLVQFLAPDYFGNPTTNNYWGIWNYGEFIGYIGIIPLLFSLYALFFRRDKKTLFFGIVMMVCFIYSLPNPLSASIYILKIPFLSTSQPTRLLGIITFCLSILAALGYDEWTKQKNRYKVFLPLILISTGIIFCFGSLQFLSNSNQSVTQKNLIVPSLLIISTWILIGIKTKWNKFKYIEYGLCFLVVVDLFRFGWKFIPFSPQEYLYPNTSTITFLQKSNTDFKRTLFLDRRIMAPNFSGKYLIQDVSGYDPLYLKRYGEYIAAMERGKPDLTPAAFNRIITPLNFESPLADLLGIQYIVSLDELKSQKIKLVMNEGQTKIYENQQSFPRAFLIGKVYYAQSDQEELDTLFQNSTNLHAIAVSQYDTKLMQNDLTADEFARINSYSANEIIIQTQTQENRLLVLTDPYYPTWKVTIDGSPNLMFRVDYLFRGVVVPKGNHTIKFINNLL